MSDDFSIDEKDINIASFSSEKLADIVVSNRYLGIFTELSIAAMKELSKRRTDGDSFEYENYISSHLADLPKLEMPTGTKSNISIASLLNKIASLKL